MKGRTVDNKNIIYSKGVIDENYVIISADEDLFRFIGPTISLITDAIHQVDVDDFLYVIENLNDFEQKNLVLRIRRSDNSFCWCLVSVSLSQATVNDKRYFNIEVSDIINLNNHYVALTKVFDMEKKELHYHDLMDSDTFFAEVKQKMEEESGNQVTLCLFGIDGHEEVLKKYGQVFYDKMFDEISTELVDYLGNRGKVAQFDDNRFILYLLDIGNESNLRSFLGSVMYKINWMYISSETALDISFSVGIAESPRNGKLLDVIYQKLLKAYEIALHKGGGHYLIYKEELHGEI